MPYDLFISYSRKDNQTNRITELKMRIEEDYLQFAGEPLNCFFDQKSIQGMDDWRHRILQGLRDSHLLLLVLSPNYLASKYCEWEIIEYLKYEHSRAAGGQGIAPVYFVEVPELDTPDFNQHAADWIHRIRRRNDFDLRQWYHEGEAALKQQDVRVRLEDLEHALHQRLSKLRRIATAPGNLSGYNPHFVGRLHEMQQLHESAGLGHFGTLTVIQGMGGLGKTSLAIQYSYAYADFYPGGRWLVKCAHQESLASAIRTLDVNLGITFDEADKQNEERAAKRILAELESRARQGAEARAGERHPPQPRVLLLLDNTTASTILQPPDTDLISGKNWLHVIATTRMSGEDFGHDPDRQKLVAIDELPIEDAVRLIESHQPGGRFPNETEQKAAYHISEILGGFTLAVEVIAVFLAEKKGNITCYALLDRLRKEGFDRIAEVTKRAINHREKLIRTTLNPTLDLLTEEENLVLTYASLLPPDAIPLPWIRNLVAEKFLELGKDAEPGYEDPWLSLVNHLLGLRLLQLVDLDPDTKTPRLVRMHRLTGEVVRNRTQPLGWLQNNLTWNLRLRCHNLEKTWHLHHWEIPSLIGYANLLLDREDNWCPTFIRSLGQWLTHYDNGQQSLSLMQRGIEFLETHPSNDPLDMSTILSNLGWALKKQGRYNEAETILRRALAIDEQTQPVDKRALAVRYNQLERCLSLQGRFAEAEPYAEKAMSLAIKAYGAEDPRSIVCVGNLGSLLCKQGKLDEAEPILCKALEMFRLYLPVDHPYIAIGQANLGDVFKEKGKLDEAELMYREALSIARRALPPDHPEIARHLESLAAVIEKQGKLDEAELMYRETLKIREKVLGENHPDILTNMNDLAVLLESKGDYAQAEPLYRRVLEAHEYILGPESSEYTIELNNHSLFLRKMNRAQEAEELLRRALSIEEKVLPSDSPKIPHRLNNLSTVLVMQDKLKEALELNNRAWDLKSSRHDITSARILFMRLVINLFSDKPTDQTIGELKGLLAGEKLTFQGNITTEWDITPVLDYIEPRISSNSFDLLQSIVLVLNNKLGAQTLDSFAEWRVQKPLEV